MTDGFADVCASAGTLRVRFEFAPASDASSVPCILDVDDFGELVGIEILDWQKNAGGPVGLSEKAGAAHWTYDDEIDALYVRLRPGSAGIQRKGIAKAHRDAEGRVIELEVPFPAPEVPFPAPGVPFPAPGAEAYEPCEPEPPCRDHDGSAKPHPT